jgi:hypothetical protein
MGTELAIIAPAERGYASCNRLFLFGLERTRGLGLLHVAMRGTKSGGSLLMVPDTVTRATPLISVCVCTTDGPGSFRRIRGNQACVCLESRSLPKAGPRPALQR